MSEHLAEISHECSRFVDGEPPDLEAIMHHAEAIAAERDRLLRAFLAAESCCEVCAAYQDQTREAWLQRWGLEDGDVPE